VALKIEVLAISMWRAASLQDIQSAGLLKPCDAGPVAAIRELDACCIIPRTEPDLCPGKRSSWPVIKSPAQWYSSVAGGRMA
jgi:hypothetical protein